MAGSLTANTRRRAAKLSPKLADLSGIVNLSGWNRRLAERIILDSAQNGTLDLPAYIHAPIETGIISLLCKTPITPNQITIAGFVIGCSAIAAFVLGRVGLGILAALAFGIIDGLDAKLSRVKIETTEHGKWEHHLDYLIENAW